MSKFNHWSSRASQVKMCTESLNTDAKYKQKTKTVGLKSSPKPDKKPFTDPMTVDADNQWHIWDRWCLTPMIFPGLGSHSVLAKRNKNIKKISQDDEAILSPPPPPFCSLQIYSYWCKTLHSILTLAHSATEIITHLPQNTYLRPPSYGMGTWLYTTYSPQSTQPLNGYLILHSTQSSPPSH